MILRPSAFRLATRVAVSAGLLAITALVACSQKKEAPTPKALTEAYQLLDQGKNDKAIILLQQTLANDPKGPQSKEAKFLLSSAYLGKAGIDVYSLHDSFHDVIFAKSLDESFWGNGGKKATTGLGDDSEQLEKAHEFQTVDSTPTSELIDRLDNGLVQLRKAVVFLNRFPDVPESNWPLLDQALDQLDELPPEKDVALYRAFIRVVYVRAFLSIRLIKGSDVGTKSWACQIHVSELNDGLAWVSQQTSLATDDVVRVFPKEATSLARIQSTLSILSEELNRSREGAPVGSQRSFDALQSKIRKAFRCESSALTSHEDENFAPAPNEDEETIATASSPQQQ